MRACLLLCVGLIALALVGCGDSSGGETTASDVDGCDEGIAPCETVTETTTMGETSTTGTTGGGVADQSASFDLSGFDINESWDWTESDGNYIRCQQMGADRMQMRFALDPANDGADSAHLDIDACGYPAEEYAAMDAGTCTPGGWSAVWRNGASVHYVSIVDEFPCVLKLFPEGNTMTGLFACGTLESQTDDQQIGISNGAFECNILQG